MPRPAQSPRGAHLTARTFSSSVHSGEFHDAGPSRPPRIWMSWSTFIAHPETAPGRRYAEKLRGQLASVSPETKQLMAELHAVHLPGASADVDIEHLGVERRQLSARLGRSLVNESAGPVGYRCWQRKLPGLVIPLSPCQCFEPHAVGTRGRISGAT